jgi:hypothetical protein
MLGWQPVMLTGLFVGLARNMFANPKSLPIGDLRRLIWTPGDDRTILIRSTDDWDGNFPEERPAIMVKPNGMQNVRLLVGDYVGTTREGHREYATAWAGSHTAFCISPSSLQAQLMALAVQQEITGFAPQLTEGLELIRLQIVDVGGPAIVEEARANTGVPVTIGWMYGEAWTVEQESRKLRSIDVKYLLDMMSLGLD